MNSTVSDMFGTISDVLMCKHKEMRRRGGKPMMDAVFEIDRDSENLLLCAARENNTFGLHFHSGIEVVYVLEGEIEVTVNGISKELGSGCAAVASSYDIHGYHTQRSSRIIVLVIPIDLVDSFNAPLQPMAFKSPFLGACEKSRELGDAARRLQSYTGLHDSMIAKGYVSVILGILADTLGLTERKAEPNSAVLVRDILLYLEQSYLRDITVGDLARKYGYNKDYLSRIFNARLGCGFQYYLNMRRARHARLLIDTTGLSLEEVMFRSGFHNRKTFSRAFQGCFHLTPLQYKKQTG